MKWITVVVLALAAGGVLHAEGVAEFEEAKREAAQAREEAEAALAEVEALETALMETYSVASRASQESAQVMAEADALIAASRAEADARIAASRAEADGRIDAIQAQLSAAEAELEALSIMSSAPERLERKILEAVDDLSDALDDLAIVASDEFCGKWYRPKKISITGGASALVVATATLEFDLDEICGYLENL